MTSVYPIMEAPIVVTLPKIPNRFSSREAQIHHPLRYVFTTKYPWVGNHGLFHCSGHRGASQGGFLQWVKMTTFGSTSRTGWGVSKLVCVVVNFDGQLIFIWLWYEPS